MGKSRWRSRAVRRPDKARELPVGKARVVKGAQLAASEEAGLRVRTESQVRNCLAEELAILQFRCLCRRTGKIWQASKPYLSTCPSRSKRVARKYPLRRSREDRKSWRTRRKWRPGQPSSATKARIRVASESRSSPASKTPLSSNRQIRHRPMKSKSWSLRTVSLRLAAR